MIQGVAGAGAAAAALQLPRVATIMAVLTGAKLTGVTAGSAPEVVPDMVFLMPARPRDIGAGAVELLHGRTYPVKSDNGIHPSPFDDFTNHLSC